MREPLGTLRTESESHLLENKGKRKSSRAGMQKSSRRRIIEVRDLLAERQTPQVEEVQHRWEPLRATFEERIARRPRPRLDGRSGERRC